MQHLDRDMTSKSKSLVRRPLGEVTERWAGVKGCGGGGGFTLIELLVVISIIGLLIAILLPALQSARESAQSISCSSNQRNVGLTIQAHATDYKGNYPSRYGPGMSTNKAQGHWTTQLQEYYQTPEVLLCPQDDAANASAGGNLDPVNRPADSFPRSYFINGFNDWFDVADGNLDGVVYGGGAGDVSTIVGRSMNERDVKNTSETIVFGEKRTTSGHYYMDLLESNGNDYYEVEQARHFRNQDGRGISNFVFLDGSVRSFAFPEALDPVNMWAVVPFYRQSS